MSYLENCLNSVMDQDYPRHRYEIIVADNGSTDNSVSFLESKYEKDITLVKFGINNGFAKGNNLAVKYAKGDLLVFLNQDTIVHNQWLSALVKGIHDNNYDVCHSNMLFPRNAEFEKAYKREFPENIYYYELTKYGYVNQVIKNHNEGTISTRAIAGGSFIIKRSVLGEIEYLFDEKFGMYNEDTDLALRLSQEGFTIGVVPSSVVYHFTSFNFKFNKNNIWKNLIMIRNRMMAYWKALKREDFIYFLPYLIFSQSHKTFTRSVEVKNGIIKSILLATSVMPLSIISFIWFISSILKEAIIKGQYI